MIKYEGLDYDLNSLFEFHVLKKLLEALFKKQKIYDIVLYGQGFDNIKLNNNNHDNNDINSKNIASLGLLKEFVESQNKLKENEKMMIELKERIDNLEDFVNTSKNKSKNSLKKTMGTNIENKGLEINNTFNIKQKNPEGEKVNENIKKKITKEYKFKIEKNGNNESIGNEEENLDKNTTNLNIEELLNKCENNQKYMNLLKQNENEAKEKIKALEKQISELNQKMANLNDNHILEIVEKKIVKIKEDNNSKFNNFIFEYNKEKERVNIIINKNIADFINLNKKNANLEKAIDDMPNKLNLKSINDRIESLNIAIEDSVDKKEIIFFTKQFNKYEKEINKLNIYKTEQEKIVSKIKEQMNSIENTLNSFKRNISSFNSLLENQSLSEILDGVNQITTKMVDIDDYNKNISLINKNLTELKIEVHDHNRIIDDIKPKMGNIVTKEDIEKMENKTNELISKQNSAILTKYADKKDIQKNIHSIELQIKSLKSEISKEKEKETKSTCMFSSKPVCGFKCASCDTYIGEIKESFQYLPWNKYPLQDNNKPYSIGSGYSRVLQSMSVEHLKYSSHNKTSKIKNKSLIDTVDEHSISFEKSIEEKNKKHKKFVPMLRVVSTKNIKSVKELPFNTEQKFNLKQPIFDFNYTQRIHNNNRSKKYFESLDSTTLYKTKNSYQNKKVDKIGMKSIKPNKH